jgi:hypothetical protein
MRGDWSLSISPLRDRRRRPLAEQLALRHFPCMEWRTGRPAKRPGIIEPCIPTRASKPPVGPQWIHEIKHSLVVPVGNQLSCGSAACVCGVPVAPSSSSRWQQSLRTCAEWASLCPARRTVGGSGRTGAFDPNRTVSAPLIDALRRVHSPSMVSLVHPGSTECLADLQSS